MKRNGLGPHEIVTGGDVARDLEGPLAALLVEQIGAPGLGPGVVAKLVDLEPRGRAVRAGSVVDLAHVHHDRPKVVPADGLIGAAAVVWLLVHLDCDGPAGLGLADSRYAPRPADVASEVGGGHGLDGRVAGHRAQARAVLVHTVHPDVAEDGVGGCQWGGAQEKQGDAGEGLHFEGSRGE